MRAAVQADLPAITARLEASAERAMFPLSNLARYGFHGDHPRSMRFWIAGEAILGLTREGLVLPFLDPAHAGAAARAMAGHRILGLNGDTAQVRALVSAMDLSDVPPRHDADEPQFALSLDDLVMPDCTGLSITPITAAPAETVIRWRAAYETEVMAVGAADARASAERVVRDWARADSHRILFRDGVPVALTGFNARLPDIVQIGGVWTPPELRGQGLARAAIALHLREAQAEGVTRATLCAANESAARAYQALGFRRIGTFTMIFYYDRPVVRPERGQ